jgi:hypothetical protein
MSYLATYPYLLTTLLLAAVSGLAVLFMPRHRKMLLLSGGLAAPMGCFAYQHTPGYWTPQRTSPFVPAFEDFLFLADWGVLAWFLAVLPVAHRLEVNPRWQRVALLYVPGALAGLPASEFLRQVVFGPAGVMYAHILLFGLFAGYCLWRRPDLWVLSVSGGVLSGLFYLAFLKGFLRFYPSYLDALDPAAMLPWKLAGVPAFEPAWPAAFGAAWPLFLAYACQARLRGKAPRVAAGGNGAGRKESAPPQRPLALP